MCDGVGSGHRKTPLCRVLAILRYARHGLRSLPTRLRQSSDQSPADDRYSRHAVAGAAYDINLRMRDEGWPAFRSMTNVREIQLPTHVSAGPHGEFAPPMEPFVVMEDDHVTVRAILVQHPPVFPSYAFRFDLRHGSIVIRGGHHDHPEHGHPRQGGRHAHP